MRHPHKWEEMLPEEFYQELERAPIVYWACGAMEEHGLHNALGVDPYTGYETCLRAVAISGGVLFPPVPFAPAGIPGFTREQLRSGQEQLYYPSLWVSREVCKQLYLELIESLADLGFRACLAYGGHWPADLLLQEIAKEQEGRVGSMRLWGGGTVSLMPDLLTAASEGVTSADLGHGMMLETAMTMAISEDWVNLPRAQRIEDNPLPSQLKGQGEESLRRIECATVSLGNRVIETGAHRLAQLAREMLVDHGKS